MSELKTFGALLSRVAKRVTVLQSAEICCGDLTLEQFQTLRVVASADEPPSLGRLSAEMRVDLSTMSRNVTVLARHEYLKRTRSAKDARVVTVNLTASGKKALATLCCDEDTTFRAIYEKVPVSERPRLVKALQILDDGLTAAAAAAPCCSPVAARQGRGKGPS